MKRCLAVIVLTLACASVAVAQINARYAERASKAEASMMVADAKQGHPDSNPCAGKMARPKCK